MGATISFTIHMTITGNMTITTLALEDRYSSAFITYESAGPSPTAAANSVQILNPTGIQLAGRSVQQTADGVLVRLRMVEESNVVGFYVWRASGVETPRRSEMILTRVSGQSGGTGYEWLDMGATLSWGDAYVLEIVKSDGSSERVVIDVMKGVSIYLPLLTK